MLALKQNKCPECPLVWTWRREELGLGSQHCDNTMTKQQCDFLRVFFTVQRLLLCEELERSSCGSVLFHGYLPPPGKNTQWNIDIRSKGSKRNDDMFLLHLIGSHPRPSNQRGLLSLWGATWSQWSWRPHLCWSLPSHLWAWLTWNQRNNQSGWVSWWRKEESVRIRTSDCLKYCVCTADHVLKYKPHLILSVPQPGSVRYSVNEVKANA